MKKKKKIRYDEVKVGEYFKYHAVVYHKHQASWGGASRITGKSSYDRYFWDNDMVIPVTVTIKVKEK